MISYCCIEENVLKNVGERSQFFKEFVPHVVCFQKIVYILENTAEVFEFYMAFCIVIAVISEELCIF